MTARYLTLTVLIACCPGLHAAELLRGEIKQTDAAPLPFTLSAENRQDPVGGDISLGEKHFRIEKVSRLGLIGGKSVSDNTTGVSVEFVIFSSSFSEQTAVGQPWVAAKQYLHCDQAYNSFLALYHFDSAAAAAKLGEVPYGKLTDDLSQSDDSIVYCFISRPPA